MQIDTQSFTDIHNGTYIEVHLYYRQANISAHVHIKPLLYIDTPSHRPTYT